MGRVYNFSAGPAVLPEEVLRDAAAEMLDYNGLHNHRTEGKKSFPGSKDVRRCSSGGIKRG